VARTARWTSALGALAVLTLLSAAPASAETLSNAEATAVRGSVAGQPADSGTVRAVDEGNGVQVTGTSNDDAPCFAKRLKPRSTLPPRGHRSTGNSCP